MNQKHHVVFYLVLSAIGAVFLLGIVFQTPVFPAMLTLGEKLVVAGFFSLLCLFGILLAIRPNWLKATFLKQEIYEKNKAAEAKRGFRGHHPDCSVFETHRILCGKNTWCAGCLGLLLGCVVSLILMILYVVVPLQLSPLIVRLFFFSGLLSILFVYIESILDSRHARVHVMLNGMFILGFFLITVSIVELSGEIVYGLYALLLCVLWLDTRIHLSRWHHSRLCKSCPQCCKVYAAAIIFGR